MINDDGDDDAIFVYTGGGQEVPRDVRRVRIAENVDTIPALTFDGCEGLIEVEGHDRLKKLERGAFKYCISLRRIKKMGGVVEIEKWAFISCHALGNPVRG